MSTLEGKRILVTGAAGGMGQAIVRKLAAEGAYVIATDVAQAQVNAVVEGVTGEAHVLDVTDLAAVVDLAESIDAVDGLVNNAGITRLVPFLESDPDLWNRLISVNLMGAIGVTHSFVKRMVREGRGGAIVNVASDAGRAGAIKNEAVYSASKGGLFSLTYSLAKELSEYRIRVNAVSPGPTLTPIYETNFLKTESGKATHSEILKAIPLGRLAQSEDIAKAVHFFLADGSSYVTGQALSINGGMITG